MSDLIDRLREWSDVSRHHDLISCDLLRDSLREAADRLAKLEDAATLFERLFNGGRLTGDEVARSTQLLEELKGE